MQYFQFLDPCKLFEHAQNIVPELEKKGYRFVVMPTREAYFCQKQNVILFMSWYGALYSGVSEKALNEHEVQYVWDHINPDLVTIVIDLFHKKNPFRVSKQLKDKYQIEQVTLDSLSTYGTSAPSHP